MKKYLFIIICSMAMAQNTETKLKEIFEKNQLMGLTVLTFNKNKIEQFNYGLANLDKKTPVTSDTKFRVASISKMFTALGLMKLYDLKKFKLDDDISTYLGYSVRNPKFPETPITFKMLMSHTSTINDGTGYDTFLSDTYNDADIPNLNSILLPNGKHFTADVFLEKKPGTFFTYCNLNYGIMGTLIEKISNKRFDVYMKDEVLKPLNLRASYNIQDIEEDKIGALYRKIEEKWKATKDDYPKGKPTPTDLSQYINGTNGVFYGPQGGLRISSEDLIKALKYLRSNGETQPKLISVATLKLMKNTVWNFDTQNGDNYNGLYNRWGLGLHILNTTQKDMISDTKLHDNFIGHAGDAYGLISDAFFSTKKNFGFVIITNGILNGFQPGKKTAFYSFEEEIFEVILKESVK